LFSRRPHYDRLRILADAARAQRKGRRKKAIALYRQVLEFEPENPDLHRKLAPLLARTRRPAEAWASYRRAVEGLVRLGFVERAIGVYREAAGFLPREAEVWLGLAGLEAQRGRRTDAVQALLAGSRRLRSRRDRPGAIRLLARARALDPACFAAGFDLSGLLARSGQRGRSLALLDELAARAAGRDLRRVRARQLRLAPGPRATWRWLAALAGSGSAARPQAARPRAALRSR
jgi:tetratricopeptide (TPR) repeat protein